MYWVTGFLGLVFMTAPYFFGYSQNTVALWTSLLLGGAVAVLSVIEGLRKGTDRWEYWFALIAGLTAIAAPFVFGFSQSTGAFWTSITIGALLAVFSGAQVLMQRGTYV